MASIDLSIVIPVYNEGKNVGELYRQIKAVLTQLKRSYEVIFVDDGSKDSTLVELQLLHFKDKHVKVISFRKNFQKSATYMAGFELASGNYVLTMDGDLQDDPHEIPEFLGRITECDMVVGWKFNRLDSLGRIVASRIFNLLVFLLTGLRLHDTDCGYRLMKQEVAKNLHLYGGLYRFIPVLASQMGYKVREVKVNHRKRKFGKTKYGISRLFKGFFDLITTKFLASYLQSPLHFFGAIGLLFTFFGFMSGAYLLIIWLLGEKIANRPLLLLSVLLIVLGIQFVSLGLLGEMITRQRKDKIYIVREFLK